jgi:hypothetical protein
MLCDWPFSFVECGGKRSATPLWITAAKKSKAPPVSAHSK